MLRNDVMVNNNGGCGDGGRSDGVGGKGGGGGRIFIYAWNNSTPTMVLLKKFVNRSTATSSKHFKTSIQISSYP